MLYSNRAGDLQKAPCGVLPYGHVSEGALDDWYEVAEQASWTNFAAVKATFPQVDLISSKKHGAVLVFDVRGNRYRIVCTVRFNRQTLFVRFAGNHNDYDKLDMENL